MTQPSAELRRCTWATTALSIAYHDREWGVPVHDDRRLFELLLLEGAQAGLSWETILAKRENYRRAFARFDPQRVARMRGTTIERLLRDPGIVRNRAKVVSAVGNAKAYLDVRREFGSFDAFAWRFVGGAPIVNARYSSSEVPASSVQSQRLSAELRRRGFRFVGPTICYAYMQATGMVDDHLITCFRHTTRRIR